VAMGNRFNYRCPKCGSPDQIEIIALVSVRLTSTGTEGDASNCTPEDWTDFNGGRLQRLRLRRHRQGFRADGKNPCLALYFFAYRHIAFSLRIFANDISRGHYTKVL
jgi:hypothetical protein